jgi:wobble nucleotide-excising tRNase
MKLNKIDKLKEHHIFRDFMWDDSIPEFKRYNLVYGWNGSGKTTISNLLRCIEKRKDNTIGECIVSIDKKAIPSSNFSTEPNLPQIRVFNREFIEENIFTETKSVSPIFYLGKDSIDKQIELESLRIDFDKKQKAYIKLTIDKGAITGGLEELSRIKAKEIKELLSSSGGGEYNYYSKVHFKSKAAILLASPDFKAKILNSRDKMKCKKQKDATSKPELPALILSISDINDLQTRANKVIAKTIVAETIETLKNDPKLSEWIENGLAIHSESKSETCLFCGNILPISLLDKYKGHFNDQFTKLMKEIDSLISEIESAQEILKSISFYSKAELHESFQSDYESTIQKVKINIEKIINNLKVIRLKLLKKKKTPFQDMDLIPEFEYTDPLLPLNNIILEHNTETKNFQSTAYQARIKLEESLICESLTTYKKKNDEIKTINSQLILLEKEIELLRENIIKSESLISESRTPAKELNKEIASYLGHDDIKFETFENGYQIKRRGEPAEGLSEGEKTALAFLYFLKTLNDKSFKIKDGIVVIDDPVSSLDANSLYCAFGFMHTKVRDAGQLIVLTHNFPFFRQVKNWFDYSHSIQHSYYMVQCSYHQGIRSSQIIKLDKLLSDYDSEYHYLFKSVYTVANETEKIQDLEIYYHLPNIARRLLEGFLSFKHPQKIHPGLYHLLNEIDFDDAKKSRIERFLNTHSHIGSLDDLEHDMSILSETPQILHDVLELIENCDSIHYKELVQLIEQTTN